MGGARTARLQRGAKSAIWPARFTPALALLPLPCPDPATPQAVPLRAHGHRCAGCGAAYRCPGPDETGFCPPLYAPCYWVELGTQLKVYRAVVAAMSRKRREMEKIAGRTACQAAEHRRRRFGRAGSLVAGFGKVVVPSRPRETERDCDAPELRESVAAV